MGLTLSLFVVYVHNVRHFSMGFSTLVMAFTAIVGLASGPLWGTLTDRLGPVPVSFVTYMADGAGLLLWAHAHSRGAIILIALALAAFGGAGWGANSTLLSRLVPEEQRQFAFGFNFLMVNLGIGLGTLISASIVDLHHPATFTTLYVVNAIFIFATGLFYLSLARYGKPSHEALHPDKAAEGWREVLADRRLLSFVSASVVLMIGGYGSQEAGYTLFVVNDLHLSVHYVGVIFFFNTLTIVLAQLFVLGRIDGKSRTRVMALVATLWAVFWLLLDLALAMPTALVVVTLIAGMIIFALGETMLQPVGSAIVNDIAPEHLRGRYNALLGLVWGMAGTVAPLLTSLYFSRNWGNWWPLGTGVTAAVGGLLMLRVRRRLSPAQDGRAPVAVQSPE